MICKISELKEQEIQQFINAYTHSTIIRHRQRGFQTKIAPEKLKEYIEKHIMDGCNYCQSEFTIRRNDPRFPRTLLTLDIIDPSIPELNIDNIQLLCLECNQTKGHNSHDDFVQFCQQVSNKFGGK